MGLVAAVTQNAEQNISSAMSPLGWIKQCWVAPYYAVFPNSWVGSLSSVQWHNIIWSMDISRTYRSNLKALTCEGSQTSEP